MFGGDGVGIRTRSLVWTGMWNPLPIHGRGCAGKPASPHFTTDTYCLDFHANVFVNSPSFYILIGYNSSVESTIFRWIHELGTHDVTWIASFIYLARVGCTVYDFFRVASDASLEDPQLVVAVKFTISKARYNIFFVHTISKIVLLLSLAFLWQWEINLPPQML